MIPSSQLYPIQLSDNLLADPINGISIYPNPAIDNLTVKLGDRKINHITIRDVAGRVVFNLYRPASDCLSIRTSGWVPGTYIAEFTGPNGTERQQIQVR